MVALAFFAAILFIFSSFLILFFLYFFLMNVEDKEWHYLILTTRWSHVMAYFPINLLLCAGALVLHRVPDVGMHVMRICIIYLIEKIFDK